jgi:hypothetical protein
MPLLYKYIGPATFDKVFGGPEHFTMKCSLPKDFNDPYELFLTLDFNEAPDALAFYADVIGELPQIPTTCFSRTPAAVPMWAHYAQNQEGFAIEVDEEKLAAAFPKSGFGDVDYMDKPRDGTSDRLHMAFGTQKPRHVHFLRTAVFSSAYYTKATCWSYENERRMLVDRTEVREVGGMLLMAAPNSCLTSIIAGPRASAELQHNLRAKAAEVGCKFFQLKIGRSSATPYFIGEDGKSYVHKDGALRAAEHTCDKCKEPSAPNAEVCSWCQIDDSHRFNAARRNPYRMLDHYGLLDSYIEGVTKIDREAAQRRRGSK